jgi:hypothetical protein
MNGISPRRLEPNWPSQRRTITPHGCRRNGKPTTRLSRVVRITSMT